jgi:hypothetical protein
MKYNLLLILISLSLFSEQSFSATLTKANVEKKGERYILHMEAELNADDIKVKEIISDYNNLTSINPYLIESNIISTSENKRTTVNLLTKACVLFICYELRQVQDFHPIKNNIIYGRIIPDQSDFKQGWSRWKIEPVITSNGTKTRLIIDTEMTPDFFIVPILGPHHIKNKIIEIATDTIIKLEIEAQKTSVEI